MAVICGIHLALVHGHLPVVVLFDIAKQINHVHRDVLVLPQVPSHRTDTRIHL